MSLVDLLFAMFSLLINEEVYDIIMFIGLSSFLTILLKIASLEGVTDLLQLPVGLPTNQVIQIDETYNITPVTNRRVEMHYCSKILCTDIDSGMFSV